MHIHTRTHRADTHSTQAHTHTHTHTHKHTQTHTPQIGETEESGRPHATEFIKHSKVSALCCVVILGVCGMCAPIQ